MSVTLIVVVVLAGGFGYWMVADFIDGRRQQAARKAQSEQARSPAPASSPGEPTWYQVLGVDADASPEKIREAYQQQISLYHPDKVASLGLEIQALASQKAQDINRAYAEGLGQRR
jgi:DnaJ-domain-containing protein 1